MELLKKLIIEIIEEESVQENSSSTNKILMSQDFKIVAEEIVKKLIILDVSQQRELLKALKKNHIHNFGNTPISINELDEYIDSL